MNSLYQRHYQTRGAQRLDYSVPELISLYRYLSTRKIIQMLYEHTAEYTTKHSAMCYDEGLKIAQGKPGFVLTRRQCVRCEWPSD